MSLPHPHPHPAAGLTVRLEDGDALGGRPAAELIVEDWVDRVMGGSWMFMKGNPAALTYAVRAAGLPCDDEVLYGKDPTTGRGHMVHNSEIAPESSGGAR